MSDRVPVPENLQAMLKYNCRNRCAICAIMNNDYTEKQGQIAHIDHNHSNSSDYDNLVWLCLAHHDKYDSKTSQSKNYRPLEILMYKKKLEAFYVAPQNNELIMLLTRIMQLVNDGDGYMFHTKAVDMIGTFIDEAVYPEKYGLSLWRQQLNSISQILQQILSIFSPSHYHLSAGDYKLVFNMGKSPDSLLEENKKLYSTSLSILNAKYNDFITAYNT